MPVTARPLQRYAALAGPLRVTAELNRALLEALLGVGTDMGPRFEAF